MTVLGWIVVVIIVVVVAGVIGVLVIRALGRGTPKVPDALEHLPSRKDQPVAYEDGRAVTEAEEPPMQAGDDAAFERALREELDEVRGEKPES